MSPASAASCDAPAALRAASRRKPVNRSMLADSVVENVVCHFCCEIWLPVSRLPPDRFEPPLRPSEGRNAPLAARREASALRTFPSAVTIDGWTCRARCTASGSVICSGCVVVSGCWARAGVAAATSHNAAIKPCGRMLPSPSIRRRGISRRATTVVLGQERLVCALLCRRELRVDLSAHHLTQRIELWMHALPDGFHLAATAVEYCAQGVLRPRRERQLARQIFHHRGRPAGAPARRIAPAGPRLRCSTQRETGDEHGGQETHGPSSRFIEHANGSLSVVRDAQRSISDANAALASGGCCASNAAGGSDVPDGEPSASSM